MILRPLGGIGNRLRAMMSRLEPGLVVQWPIDWELAFGKWEDVFEPIDGVTIVNVVRKSNDSFDEPCDLETCDPAPGDWGHRYDMLCPVYDVAHRIHDLCRGRSFDAMHIRRTDHRHVVPAGAGTWDHEFQRFITEARSKIYLATDNAETQDRYLEYPNLFVNKRIGTGAALAARGDHTRHTSLADSVVDLFACAEANRFMGTRYSSFTHTIEILRGLR
jgi:hypothetical protein